jgi:hypothetical protein
MLAMKPLPYAWTDFVPFVLLYLCLACLIALLALNFHSTALALLSVATVLTLLGFGIQRVLLRSQEAYRRRIKANETTLWDVWVNGVKVGTVTDARYAAIQRHVYLDASHAFAQLLNLGHMAWRVIDKLMLAVPLQLIWITVGLAVFSPQSLTLSAAELQQAAKAVFTVVLWLSVITLIIQAALGARFGFKNYYAAAVGRLLRQHCGTPAEGDVHLSRISPAAVLDATSAQ